jgi:allophanate hydrolase subunit 2
VDRLASAGESRAASDLKRPLHGVRSYLAVAGGIDVPEVMGSSSTDQKAGIGGHEGRLLARWRSSGD